MVGGSNHEVQVKPAGHWYLGYRWPNRHFFCQSSLELPALVPVIGKAAIHTGRSSVICRPAAACHHSWQLPLLEWSCAYSNRKEQGTSKDILVAVELVPGGISQTCVLSLNHPSWPVLICLASMLGLTSGRLALFLGLCNRGCSLHWGQGVIYLLGTC